jgi:hypothetical protein
MHAVDHSLDGDVSSCVRIAHAAAPNGSAAAVRSDKAGDWSEGRSEEPMFSGGFATGRASEVFRSQPHACTASFPMRRTIRGTSLKNRLAECGALICVSSEWSSRIATH